MIVQTFLGIRFIRAKRYARGQRMKKPRGHRKKRISAGYWWLGRVREKLLKAGAKS